jgi:DNA repair exonuclease SbcCD nuclease subunit
MHAFRFVHAADLHLDTPFEGISRTSPAVAEALRDASLDAWDALVDLTLRRQAAFLLIAGDVYDGAERGVRAQLRFLRGLERLAAAGVQTLVVHGNHDPLDGWSAIQRWPDGVTVFESGEVQSVAIERGGELLATVHGVSYGSRDARANLALGFRRAAASGLQIGLLHCNVGSDPGHAAYSPCTLADLQAAGLDYWALGHVHDRRVLSEGPCWAVYPGNLQGRSPRASERGAKGALVVEAAGGSVTGIEFEPLDRVRFERIEVDAGAVDDVPALLELLQAEVLALRAAAGGRSLVVRGVVTGRGGLHADLVRPKVLEELLGELRAACAPLAPFVWWDAVRDETRAGLDLDAIRLRDDFSTALLHRVDAVLAAPDRFADLIGAPDEALPEARLRRLLGEHDEDLGALLDEARDRALDLLERGEDAA